MRHPIRRNRDVIAYRLVVASIRVLSWLPLGLVRWLGRRLGELIWLGRTRMQRSTRRNVDLAYPQVRRMERRRLAIESLRQTATIYMESGMVWHWPTSKIDGCLLTVHGSGVFGEDRKGKGILMLVPHFGNWEMLSYYFASKGPLTALYENRQIQGIEDQVNAARERHGGRLVPATRAGLRTLLLALRRGELVAVLPDQVPARGNGVMANFMGREALTGTLSNRLLQKTEARACLATALRVSGGFEVWLDVLEEAVYDPDSAVAANAINAAIELAIARAPAQYQWEYKRFRIPGGPDIYD